MAPNYTYHDMKNYHATMFGAIRRLFKKPQPPKPDLDLNMDLPPTIQQLEQYLFSVAGRRALLRYYKDPALLIPSAMAQTALIGLQYIQGGLNDCSANKDAVRANARKQLDYILKEWAALPLSK